MKYRKTLAAGLALASLVAPTAALAAAPDGTYTVVPKANANASPIGMQSSQITQNGQFVSGNGEGLTLADQTTYPGSRAELVQVALGH
jgi:hypothetical protein